MTQNPPLQVAAHNALSKVQETTQYPFVSAPMLPSREGPAGIRYDFNDGARVLLPEGRWRVALIDEDSGNILFHCESGTGWVHRPLETVSTWSLPLTAQQQIQAPSVLTSRW